MTENELYHHGILGMKWGKRNGPPYPLDPEDHSKSEKDAGYEKSLTKAQLDTYRTKQLAKTAGTKKYSQYKNMSDEDLQKDYNRQKIIDDRNKRIMTAALIIGGSALAGGIYLAYRNGSIDKIASYIQEHPEMSDLQLAEEAKHIIKENGDLLIKAGEDFHRVNGYSNFDLSKANDAVYAAFTKDDIVTYRALLANPTGGGKRYDVTIQAMDDIIAPSREKAEKIFKDLMKNDNRLQKELIEQIATTVKNRKGNENISWLQAEAFAENMVKKDDFQAAVYALVGKGPATDKFIKAVKENGYNAMLDYHDIHDKLSEMPIMLFDKEALKVTGERVISAAEQYDSLVYLKENKVLAYKKQLFTKMNVDMMVNLGKEKFEELMG